MDESLYDEFGNYIGPELSGSDEEVPPPLSSTAPVLASVAVIH